MIASGVWKARTSTVVAVAGSDLVSGGSSAILSGEQIRTAPSVALRSRSASPVCSAPGHAVMAGYTKRSASTLATIATVRPPSPDDGSSGTMRFMCGLELPAWRWSCDRPVSPDPNTLSSVSRNDDERVGSTLPAASSTRPEASESHAPVTPWVLTKASSLPCSSTRSSVRACPRATFSAAAATGASLVTNRSARATRSHSEAISSAMCIEIAASSLCSCSCRWRDSAPRNAAVPARETTTAAMIPAMIQRGGRLPYERRIASERGVEVSMF